LKFYKENHFILWPSSLDCCRAIRFKYKYERKEESHSDTKTIGVTGGYPAKIIMGSFCGRE